MDKFIMLWAMLFIMARFCHGITHVDSECSQARNTTVNTIYRSNLRSLLTSLATNAPREDGFFNTSVGNGTDRVYGLAWCRADVSANACSSCLNGSINIPIRECPEIKNMVIWSSSCSLRLSNESFFGQLWNSSSSTYGNSGLDDPDVFTRGFLMMEKLARNVSDQPLMFATAVIDVGEKGKRYGMGQCSRDLSKLDCENCLENLLTSYNDYVLNRTGWEMMGISCGMWYDNYAFYENSTRPNPTPNTSGGWHNRGDMILALLAATIVSYILDYMYLDFSHV